MMARILAYTIEKPGHYPVFVPILQELRRRGHQVEFALFSSDTKHSLGGIRAHRVSLAAEDLAGLDHQVRRRWAWEFEQFAYYGEPVAQLLRRTIAKAQPDILLIDPMLWGGMICAEATGLPWASIAHNPLLFRALGLDVRGPGRGRPRTRWGAWARWASDTIRRQEENGRYLKAINSVRQKWGLRQVRHWDDIYTIPPLVLVTSAPPFEYSRTDWSPGLHFLGPLIWEPPGTIPRWVELPSDRPLILLCGSSIRGPESSDNWESKAIDALGEMEVEVIATLSRQALPRQLPSNIRTALNVPHSRLLPFVKCVICHGGPGIVHKALAAGVPVVAVPFAYDRFEVARRLEDCGAGVSVSTPLFATSTMKEAVRLALSRSSKAQAVAQAFGQCGGAPHGSDLIEALLPS